MSSDPEIRNVSDVTTGDFIAFQILLNAQWRPVRISLTALAKLGARDNAQGLEAFSLHEAQIKDVAYRLAIAKTAGIVVLLNSDHF